MAALLAPDTLPQPRGRTGLPRTARVDVAPSAGVTRRGVARKGLGVGTVLGPFLGLAPLVEMEDLRLDRVRHTTVVLGGLDRVEGRKAGRPTRRGPAVEPTRPRAGAVRPHTAGEGPLGGRPAGETGPSRRPVRPLASRTARVLVVAPRRHVVGRPKGPALRPKAPLGLDVLDPRDDAPTAIPAPASGRTRPGTLPATCVGHSLRPFLTRLGAVVVVPETLPVATHIAGRPGATGRRRDAGHHAPVPVTARLPAETDVAAPLKTPLRPRTPRDGEVRAEVRPVGGEVVDVDGGLAQVGAGLPRPAAAARLPHVAVGPNARQGSGLPRPTLLASVRGTGHNDREVGAVVPPSIEAVLDDVAASVTPGVPGDTGDALATPATTGVGAVGPDNVLANVVTRGPGPLVGVGVDAGVGPRPRDAPKVDTGVVDGPKT